MEVTGGVLMVGALEMVPRIMTTQIPHYIHGHDSWSCYWGEHNFSPTGTPKQLS